MKNISIWEDSANHAQHFRTFAGNIDAEVVVIGGGITGLTAALILSDAGKKVIVLEARRIGLGTTGNSTGNLYVTVDEHLSSVKKKWNADVMKSIVTSRTEALNLIESNVTRFNIDCDFRRTAFSYFAETDDKDAQDFITREKAALADCGLNASSLAIDSLPFPVKKTLSVGGQAQFHPLNYIRGLAAGLSARCEIYENSPVTDFDDGDGVVITEKGRIKAKHVIMATHTPKGVYMVQSVLGPYREHGVAARLKTGACPDGIFWGLEKPKHSIRSLKVGGENYVMVIGDKYKTGQGEDTNQYVSKLEDYLRAHFDIAEITHTWGGQQYRPADGLPYIGKHGKHMYFATGFSSDGLVYGSLGAMIIGDLINGKQNRWEETYKFSRFTPLKSFKEFFRENANNFAQYLKDTPWNRDTDTLKGIFPGEAKIVEVHGEKLAVFRDEDGLDHVCSAVCTHMKCIVNWNPAEKTWDCPCHGSRFTINGNVIEGPAIVPLPKIDVR